jgi:hypothetical protein
MNIGTGKSFLIIVSPTAISQKSSPQPREKMEQEKFENSVSRPASSEYATAGKGYFSGTCTQLIKDIDEGWRYFWKKRGFDPPPELYSDRNDWFGREEKLNEKESAEKSKQKEAERIQGIQRAGREFLKGQGL